MRKAVLLLLLRLCGFRLRTVYQAQYQEESGNWMNFLWWNIPTFAYAKEHALYQKGGMYPTRNRIRKQRYLLIDEKIIFDCISKERTE